MFAYPSRDCFNSIAAIFSFSFVTNVEFPESGSSLSAASVFALRRKVGDTPPVFPNGWFRATDSKCLKKGQVKSVYLFGKL